MMQYERDERDEPAIEIGTTGRLYQDWQSAGRRFHGVLAKHGFVATCLTAGRPVGMSTAEVSEEELDEIDDAEMEMRQAWRQYRAAVNKN